MGNILIVAEHKDGKLRSPTANAVTAARKLQEVRGSGDLIGVLIGQGAADAAAELGTYGLTKVYAAGGDGLGTYLAETHAPAVVAAAGAADADVVIGTATAMGKDVLPRVAALLGVGMAAEVSEVVGAKLFKRPMMAGNAIGTVEVQSDKMVVSVRQTAWEAAQPGDGGAAVESLSVEADALGAEIVRVDTVTSARPDLAEADAVVSGGRGMQNAENFKYLEALADALGGAMGATRAACDAGMVPNDLQVGQTGKVVAPDLYIAVGISGAIQHLAGMKGSKVIVAINKNGDEPIFQVADYGLVAKWEDTVEDLTRRVLDIKAG